MPDYIKRLPLNFGPAQVLGRMKSYRVLFSGHVQGVGFRDLSRRIAKRYTVTGWVRNLSNGQVELHMQGPEDQCYEFLINIQRAMDQNITEIIKQQADSIEGLTTFDISFDGA